MVVSFQIEDDTFRTSLNSIHDMFISQYTNEVEKPKAIHHFVNNETFDIKNEIDKIRYSDYIRNTLLSQHQDLKYVFNVEEMDEIYYFFPRFTGIAKVNGVDPHKDGIYRLSSNQILYRVLIGLTINSDIKTCFDRCYTISKHEIVAFDYNNDLHYVEGSNSSNTKRLLLKVHFIVSKTPNIQWFKHFHIWYANYTRKNMEYAQNLENESDKTVFDRVYLWCVLHASWFNLYLYHIIFIIIFIIIVIFTIVIYTRYK